MVAISVVIDQGDDGRREAQALERGVGATGPGVALRVLHTQFASVVRPIIAFIDEAREHDDRQIVVLIPVVIPEHLRYRILHNQIDHLLTAALRDRADVVVARVAMPLQATPSALVPFAVDGPRDSHAEEARDD